jgi:tRNA-dihydrouridine synthase A
MAEPALVADCYRAMAGAVSIPVTVKTRIGIDDHDDYDFLRTFVSALADAGCRAFYVHARKAMLEGLSPKQNREVPPLRHDMALRLKRDFPGLQIVLNGGLRTPADVRRNLASFDGVMIGREAYNNPYVLALIENDQYGTPLPGRDDVVDRYLSYVDLQLRQGIRLHAMTRHILGLYAGEPGARFWRRALSEGAAERSAGLEVIERARAARLTAAA